MTHTERWQALKPPQAAPKPVSCLQSHIRRQNKHHWRPAPPGESSSMTPTLQNGRKTQNSLAVAFVKASINCKPPRDSASLIRTKIYVEHQHPPVHIITTSNQLIQAAGYGRASRARVMKDCLWTGAASSPRGFRRGSLGKGWDRPGPGACPAPSPAGAQREPSVGPPRAQGTLPPPERWREGSERLR